MRPVLPWTRLCSSSRRMRSRAWSACEIGFVTHPGSSRMQHARDLEARGRQPEAIRAYDRAIAVLQLVYKFDQRSKNPNIKDMIGKRLEELLGRKEVLAIT
mmetsp:Transcript_48449/g.112277  ORF Transcript_48449/g.112277 Transcript_48449/m.112277 type:complete len:101 (+) Transcript_48449:221-523(+)